MPARAQKITKVNSLRYFMEIMRIIFFKGSGVVNLWVDYLALAGLAVFANVWAVLNYRKTS